jgi:hypothetical protein
VVIKPQRILWQLAITVSSGNWIANTLNALADVQEACFLPLASC